MKTKRAGQGLTRSSSCPRPGAITGTAMNTMKISDITSAMARPVKRSRTTELAMTLVAEAPMPCTARKTSNVVKSGAKAAAKAQAM